jgi:hypothetical protein
MLIPHECHTNTFQVGTPVVNTSWVPTTVVATQQSYAAKHKEEKERRRRRGGSETLPEDDDEMELSIEVKSEQGVGPTFSSLLSGLADAY